MDWSLKCSLFISDDVLFLRLVMASEVSPLLIQYGSLSIAYFRAFVIRESLEVGSRGGVADKSWEGAASPGGVVDESVDGLGLPGVV